MANNLFQRKIYIHKQMFYPRHYDRPRFGYGCGYPYYGGYGYPYSGYGNPYYGGYGYRNPYLTDVYNPIPYVNPYLSPLPPAPPTPLQVAMSSNYNY